MDKSGFPQTVFSMNYHLNKTWLFCIMLRAANKQRKTLLFYFFFLSVMKPNWTKLDILHAVARHGVRTNICPLPWISVFDEFQSGRNVTVTEGRNDCVLRLGKNCSEVIWYWGRIIWLRTGDSGNNHINNNEDVLTMGTSANRKIYNRTKLNIKIHCKIIFRETDKQTGCLSMKRINYIFM